MSKFRALLFDLDDTLYPERSFVVSGFHAAGEWISARLGRPTVETAAELLALHDGGARADTFDRWLESHGFEVQRYVDSLVNAYRQHTPRIEPYTGVRDLLARLRTTHRLGLISDGLHDVQRRKLWALGMEEDFEAMVFSDQIGRDAWKPSSKPFEKALSILSLPPQGAVYIADNPIKDFIGPRALGMTTIRVRHEGGYYAGCEPPTFRHAPDYQVYGIADLEQIIYGN